MIPRLYDLIERESFAGYKSYDKGRVDGFCRHSDQRSHCCSAGSCPKPCSRSVYGVGDEHCVWTGLLIRDCLFQSLDVIVREAFCLHFVAPSLLWDVDVRSMELRY